MTTLKHTPFLLLALACEPIAVHAQVQIGQNILEELTGDNIDMSVSMPDAYTVAIGAPHNYVGFNNAGHVRVYSWNGSGWLQKGLDIDGEAPGDRSGWCVSMPDANTVAIGAPNNGTGGSLAGHVRVYSWNGTAWMQKGLDIDGEATSDNSGKSLSMPDANTVAIGASQNDGNGSNAGHVRVYGWNGSAWVQKGADIDGEAAGDQSGKSLSMPDANTVAIGATNNSGGANYAGHVRVYGWSGSAWVQKGADIDGEAAQDGSGWSLSMPDVNTVAIGTPANAGNGSWAGHVRVYGWDGSAWVQKGMDIDGAGFDDQSGVSVSMPNANTIAIGANFVPLNGRVRVYAWYGSAWVQLGLDIAPQEGGNFGWSVSMPDANTLAIGATGNAVQVYSIINTLGILDNTSGTQPMVSPNPTKGKVAVDLGSDHTDVTVVVRNILGQETLRKTYASANRLEICLEGDAGVYLLEITSNDKRAVVRVLKE
ncbi:MAG: T9SS type A sorting domain-containing protein [Flavobacteriales bacterium]|nr:T9SS type A sorting domain-containing protein [Flavobacteriales bacterium]